MGDYLIAMGSKAIAKKKNSMVINLGDTNTRVLSTTDGQFVLNAAEFTLQLGSSPLQPLMQIISKHLLNC